MTERRTSLWSGSVVGVPVDYVPRRISRRRLPPRTLKPGELPKEVYDTIVNRGVQLGEFRNGD